MNRPAPDCTLCGSVSTTLFLEKPRKREGPRRYFRCGVCDLVFLDPAQRLSPELEKARYEQHQNLPGDEGYAAFLETLAAPLAERIPRGAEGLDFGCGPSSVLRDLLAARGLRAEGYDPFFAPRQDLLGRRWAFIACSEAAEHFFEPRREFTLIDRLLDEGGKLGLLTGVLERPEDFTDWSYHRDPTHVSFYSPRTLRWIGAAKGWSAEFPHPRVAIFSK